MVDGPFDPETGELISRDPSLADLVELCRQLYSRGAAFLVVGGFAVRANGYARHTGDIDLLIDTSPENEAKVFAALATLPDGCVRELDPGDVSKYLVVRVADEILVDLMASASGIDYAEASKSITIHEIDGVPDPLCQPGTPLAHEVPNRTRERPRRPVFPAPALRGPGENASRKIATFLDFRLAHSAFKLPHSTFAPMAPICTPAIFPSFFGVS